MIESASDLAILAIISMPFAIAIGLVVVMVIDAIKD